MLKAWMILPVITLAGLLSCNIINPAEDIPSYIKVDTFLVKVTNFDQGSARHNITCVKLNVGGTTLGFFEMPTMAPSLITGSQSLYIEPGIELNGITASRSVYPFFKPYIGTGKFDLKQGEVITVSPTTTYKDQCKFVWMEEFEDAGVSFLYPSYSDTVFRTQKDTVCEGHYSGAVYVDSKHRFFEAYSSTDFALPKTGTPVLLEFDYMSNTLMQVGLYVIKDSVATWTALVNIRPMDHWKRIYIDLNTTTADNQAADLFRPGFRIGWDSTGRAKQAVLMDNLKLIHYK